MGWIETLEQKTKMKEDLSVLHCIPREGSSSHFSAYFEGEDSLIFIVTFFLLVHPTPIQ
jgi:hypothetical protein